MLNVLLLLGGHVHMSVAWPQQLGISREHLGPRALGVGGLGHSHSVFDNKRQSTFHLPAE